MKIITLLSGGILHAMLVAVIVAVIWKLILILYSVITNPVHYYKLFKDKEYRKQWREGIEKIEKIEKSYEEIDKTQKITEEDLAIFTAIGPWEQENWLTVIREAEKQGNDNKAKIIAKKMTENMLYTSLRYNSFENMREVLRTIHHYEEDFIPKSVKETVFEVWEDREKLINIFNNYKGEISFEEFYNNEINKLNS